MAITIHNKGYVRICKDGKDILEHRLVMEQKLGRKLTKHEIVHHKDKNKKNNKEDNLELTNRKEHPKHHRKDKPMVNLECTQCGKIFELAKAQYKYRLKINKSFYCSKKCVGLASKKYLLKRVHVRNPLYHKIIIKGFKEGLTGYAIAKKYNLNRKTVYSHLKELKK